MRFDFGTLQTAALIALALISAACGKKTDARGDAEVPDVSSEVPEVPTSGGSADADARELERYQLTMANLRKYAAAQANVNKLYAQNPSLKEKDEAEDEEMQETFDDFEKSINRRPHLRKAIADAGLSAREGALIGWALL